MGEQVGWSVGEVVVDQKCVERSVRRIEQVGEDQAGQRHGQDHGEEEDRTEEALEQQPPPSQQNRTTSRSGSLIAVSPTPKTSVFFKASQKNRSPQIFL